MAKKECLEDFESIVLPNSIVTSNSEICESNDASTKHQILANQISNNNKNIFTYE